MKRRYCITSVASSHYLLDVAEAQSKLYLVANSLFHFREIISDVNYNYRRLRSYYSPFDFHIYCTVPPLALQYNMDCRLLFRVCCVQTRYGVEDKRDGCPCPETVLLERYMELMSERASDGTTSLEKVQRVCCV